MQAELEISSKFLLDSFRLLPSSSRVLPIPPIPSKFLPIPPDSSDSFQIPPESSRSLRFLPNSSRVLPIPPEPGSQVEAELCRARAELTQVVAQRDELQRKVYQLSGDDEEARAMLQEQAAAEKGKRVESFGRQVVRRMLHDGVRRGWTAWLERHEARKYALGQLQRTAVRLRTYKVKDDDAF